MSINDNLINIILWQFLATHNWTTFEFVFSKTHPTCNNQEHNTSTSFGYSHILGSKHFNK